MLKEHNELKNRYTHICWKTIKQDIGSKKQDIGSAKQNEKDHKQDIQKNKQQIVVSDMISKKTRQHIQVLFEGFGYERFFGRTEVMTKLSIIASPASALIKKMLNLDIISPMKGKGKGKYLFVRKLQVLQNTEKSFLKEEWGKLIKLYTPVLEDLWFRQEMMADTETMSYNQAWGGTIPFPKEEWHSWYDYWIVKHEGKRYYRYLRDNAGHFIGELAYHYDNDRKLYLADIIVYAPYRKKGYGGIGLDLLCNAAKQNGVKLLYDDLAIDNPAITMFLQNGFMEEYRTHEIIMLKKEL